MVTIEEFADGILQITSTDSWDAAAWESVARQLNNMTPTANRFTCSST